MYRPLEIHSCIYRKTPLSKLRSGVYETVPPFPVRTKNKVSDLLNEDHAVVPTETPEIAKDEVGEMGEEVSLSPETVEAQKEEVSPR